MEINVANIPFQTAFGKHRRVSFDTGSLSLTDPSFADDCDINVLMSKYRTADLIPHVTRYQGQYGDFSEAVDYLTAQQIIIDADEAFMSLPAHIRSRFENDPAQFLEFVHNPDNISEMQTLGLLNSELINNNTNEAQPNTDNDEPSGE